MLIDTGANKSFIDPAYLNPKRIQKIQPITVRTLFQNHEITEKIIIKGLQEFGTEEPLEFFSFKFHEYFDGLIGLEIIQQLGIRLDFQKSLLETDKVKIPLLFKPNCASQFYNIPSRAKQIIQIPVDTEEGEFYIKPIQTQNNLIIPEGIYKAENWRSTIEIANFTDQDQPCLFEQPIKTESLKNYHTEINHSSISMNTQNSQDITNLIRVNHLNIEEEKAIKNLCLDYEKIFLKENQVLTFTNRIKHQIDLRSDKPIFTKSYRYPHIHKEEVKNQIDKMLQDGIIRPSYSPWSSPIWIVPKKVDASGKTKWRLVIDYRKLNEQTIDDRYPLPNITEILDKLGRCMYFTTLDLASGFHQIELHPRDIEKTAFTVDYGHFEYVRMPFGLKNAPSTFQRVMDNVLGELQGNTCLCYMDDIIIFSTSLQEHINSLQKVFERLKQANLKVQLDKSEFLHREIAFLGHIVTGEGVKPNPDKIKAVQNFPIPRTEKQIKSFLGLIGYYRKFIKNFADITKPLTQCLRKDKKITLDDEYLKCFEYCKQLLCNDPILQYPDFEKEFILTTDASNFALGAVLSQGIIGSDKPVCYASRTLTQTEQNYSTIEKELLSIVWSAKYFRPYLFGRKFTIVTDHKPLTWLFSLKEPNSKLVRWRLKLEEYDYTIIYKKGTKNTNADGLSRIEPESMEINHLSDDDSNSSRSSNQDTQSKIIKQNEIIPTTETPINEFKTQIILKTVMNVQNLEVKFEILFSSRKRYTIQSTRFDEKILTRIVNEYLTPNSLTGLACDQDTFRTLNSIIQKYFKNSNLKIIRAKYLRLDVEEQWQQINIIKEIHDKGHRGITENVQQVKRNYYFPKMRNLIQKYINKCETCQTQKYDRLEKPIQLEITETPGKPIEILHIDIFSINNLKYLTILDKFSKFGSALLLRTQDGLEVVKLMKTYLSIHGKPLKIISDHGTEFKSIIFKDFCKLHNIILHLTSPKSSTGNSPVERFHSTLIEIYRILYSKNKTQDPDDLMLNSLIIYNNTIHSATQLTPIELKNGHYSKNELFSHHKSDKLHDYIKKQREQYQSLCKIIQQKNLQNKQAIINKRNSDRIQPPEFRIDDIIYEKDNRRNKLAPRFTKNQVQKNNKITVINQNNRKIHKSKIKNPLQVRE